MHWNLRGALVTVCSWTATSIVSVAAFGAVLVIGAGVLVAFPFVFVARAFVVR